MTINDPEENNEPRSSTEPEQTPSEVRPTEPENHEGKVEEYPQPNEEDRVEIVPVDPRQYQYNPNNGPTSSQPAPSQEEQRAFATAQRMSMFSLIGAAVSYFIGGVPLSLLAFIVAIVAYRKIKDGYEHASTAMQYEWAQSMRMIRVALVLSGGGIIINGIQTYMLFNALQDAGYGSMLTGGATGAESAGGSSVWG